MVSRISNGINIMNSSYKKLGVFLLLGVVLSGQARLRVPDGLPCDRNELTSYTGAVTKYSRNKTHVEVTINTDSDTTESVKAPIAAMRWQGQPFREEHWKQLEARPGELRGRARVTAWVCNSGAVVLDWLSPSPQR